MAESRSIIVGGGISAGSPFALGGFTKVANVDPPTINTGELFERVQSAVTVITAGVNSWPLATEEFQIIGGLISDTGAHDNFVGGRTAVADPQANARNIVIGVGAGAFGGGVGTPAAQNVCIGYATGLIAGQGDCVLIGPNIFLNAASNGVVAIGSSMVLTNSCSGPYIGAAISAQGAGVLIGNQASASNINNYVGIGRDVDLTATGATAIGDNADASHTNSVTIGRNAISVANNGLVIGAVNVGITSMLIGEGVLAAAAAAGLAWTLTNSQGADVAGGNLTVTASLGTGNAITGGKIILQSGTPGASGVGGQAAATRLEIMPRQNANGAAVNFVATNSPGAGAGTLLNAPTAGNPEWIPILFNGNLRFLPAWP